MQASLCYTFCCCCFIRRSLKAEAFWSYPASTAKFASSSEPIPLTT